MLTTRDNLLQGLASLRSYRMRTALTVLGLTMGVATLITVMTLIQGANAYVEEKVANLGTDVFQVAKSPFTPGDFDLMIKSLKYKVIEIEDYEAVAEACPSCDEVGASATASVRARYGTEEIPDVSLIGHTANMTDIDTRTVETGRYFTSSEDDRSAAVCIAGTSLVDRFFGGQNPLGKTIRVGNGECQIIGTFEKIGSVLGQDRDSFVVVPMRWFQKQRGRRRGITIEVKASGGDVRFERAMDEVRAILRARRHRSAGEEDDFFFGTKESYMDLWRKISSGFFGVFILVSTISALVGGIVIMNVMLVSVTDRTKEIGIRRAMGASEHDILKQFLTESVIQCLLGGAFGIAMGVGCALLLRVATAFPASVQPWVAILGLGLSSSIGLFFGIYPASRAARLDPVEALRAE